MADRLIPCLWFDFDQARPAAEFYVSLGLPNSGIRRVMTTPADNPSTKAGDDLLVEFELDGRVYLGLNGGPRNRHTEAVSFMILTEDQAQTDQLWTAITSHGGRESACGWCQDRWGVHWQITPRRLLDYLNSPDPNAAKAVFVALESMTRIDIAALDAAVSALKPSP